MTGSAPAMSPSDLPVEVALDRATGARREEADELLQLLAGVTGEEPVVWAGRIIGYGEHEFEYTSGHSGLAPELAFASGAREHTFSSSKTSPPDGRISCRSSESIAPARAACTSPGCQAWIAAS